MSVLVWEAICVARYSAWTVLHDFALRIPVEWLVRILLLTSMILQLVMVVLGARRYLSSSGILRFLVWGAYISADAVAVSALGTMMHSARSGIYAIWASVLLIHLGGPDAITAYSMADNDLWLRHGFNMVYQVSVAAYVIYGSSLKGRPLAAAILLLLVGFIKYAERTLALRYGSYPQIVMSSLPISKYMESVSVAVAWRYIVMGEDRVERNIEQQKAASSQNQEELGMSYVTIEDVKKAKISGRGYDLCVSHALFKMYKRRFGSLYFVEGDHKNTRAFWVKQYSGIDAFRLVEIELKFMYDAVFSKYSNAGFTKWGMLVRFLVTILLGAAGYLILGERESRQAQRMVTYIVISAAFVVEVFQIWRVILSDWTRVHLICAYVVASRRPESLECFRLCYIFQQCKFQVIRITMDVVGKFQDFVGGNKYLSEIVGGKSYWSNRLPQHCLIETWLNRSPIMCKIAELFPKPEKYIVECYSEKWHVHRVSVKDDLKEFIFEIFKKACSTDKSEECRQNIYNFEKALFEGETEIPEVLKSHVNLEEIILIWHIATTLCDWQSGLPRQKETEEELLQKSETGEKLAQQKEKTEKNVELSRMLSRYCAYLLLSRPNLLPLHPKMAKIAYMRLVNQLLDTLPMGSILQKNPEYLLHCKHNDDLLGSGAKLAQVLLNRGENERWELLAQYWGKLVIYMAVYNKAIFHAECVAAGGEFLSLVWVLLAHMGCGEQSDSAVTKKVEMQSDKELAITNKNVEVDEVQRKLTDREKELDEVKNDLKNHQMEFDAEKKRFEDRGKELDTVKKNLEDRENAFAEMGKDLAAMKEDRENKLAARKDGLSNPEEELAATKKIVRNLEEELAATRKILRDREEDFAAMKKNLLLRKGNFE